MRIGPFIQLMRPGDWLKNVLVLAAVVFAGLLTDAGALFAAGVAFLAFCLLSSGFYAINDALDAATDRTHPLKRHRPVAAGVVSGRKAAGFGAVLVAAGVVLGFTLNVPLGLTCLTYVLLQTAYNVRLKRVLLVDVIAIAIGFVLRASAGAFAIEIPLSVWLVLVVFFLCVYLGFIKRMADLASAELRGDPDWHSPAGYISREQLNWMLSVSASLAIATYLIYSLSDHQTFFRERAMAFAFLSPLVIIAVHRFYLRAQKGLSDRPLDALIEDKGVQASVVLFAIGAVVILYVERLDDLLGRFFLR